MVSECYLFHKPYPGAFISLSLGLNASQYYLSPHKDTVAVMLVTTLSWWLYDGDRFKMLATVSLSWQFFRYDGGFVNVLNRSPTSQTCRQHIASPTSFTNIYC